MLRLMETFTLDDVATAVHDAIERDAVGFDAIKHLVFCRIERRENIIAVGHTGTGKNHIAPGRGLAACQKGLAASSIPLPPAQATKK